MSPGISAALRDHDNVAKSRRGILPRQNQGLPRNAVIGIVLGLIALISLVFLAVLVWRLVRLHREVRPRPPIDLLEEARRSSTRTDDTKNGLGDLQYDKPLPRMPSGISLRGPHFVDISPASEQPIHLSIEKPPLVQLPPPVIYPDKATHPDAVDSPPSSPASRSFQRDPPPAKRRVNERFKVVNVTEADEPDLQSAYRRSPDHARGRDPPFPSKAKQASQDVKRGASTAGSSYHLHLSTDPRGSDTTPSRPPPLAIVAPRTVSNVVVEDVQTVRKPNGTQGQGRIVTLSVLFEDTEPSTSDLSAHGDGFAAAAAAANGTARRDTLDQFFEVYAGRRGDLPPYSPRDERR